MCTDFYEAQATLSRRKQVTMFGHTNYSLEEETREGWGWGGGVAGGLKVQIYLQGKKHLVCVLSPVVFIVVGVHTKK